MIHNWCKFGDASSKLWQVIAHKSPIYTNLARFNAQMTLKVKVNVTIFSRDLGGSKIHIWCKFGDPRSKTWRVIVWTSPFLVDFVSFDPKWPWRSRSINTIFSRALEGPVIHNWCKFGDASSKAWRVIMPKSLFFIIWRILTPKIWWPWRSRSINTIFNRVLEGPKIHIWCKFGDPSSKAWLDIALTSLFLADFNLFDPKWPWRSRSINTIFNRVLEGPKTRIWCKFGDPSSKAWCVIAPKSPFFANLGRFNVQMTLKIKVNLNHFQWGSGGS